jgi:hypothetical protein
LAAIKEELSRNRFETCERHKRRLSEEMVFVYDCLRH